MKMLKQGSPENGGELKDLWLNVKNLYPKHCTMGMPLIAWANILT